jgi:hypothetical protein
VHEPPKTESQAPADDPNQVNDRFSTASPTAQNQLDILAGTWTSGVPVPGEATESGPRTDLFDDERIHWALAELGSVEGQSVLELGPLEAGHTTMLERAGAWVTAVEAHQGAFLRCLVVKNLLGLRAQFHYGDCVEYLRRADESFELCVASGILYHMTAPLELLSLVAKRCRRVFLWTHYWGEEIMAARPDVAERFADTATETVEGYSATLHRYEYREGAAQATFCGGSRPTSAWLAREDITRALAHFGFHNLRVAFDEPYYPHGPAFALVAEQ